MRVSNVIIRPVVTEKSMALEADNKYVFLVNMRASKGAVANEVTRIYGVDVAEVNTMIMPGKKKRILRTNKFVKTKKRKKAVVRVADGQKIELVGK